MLCDGQGLLFKCLLWYCVSSSSHIASFFCGRVKDFHASVKGSGAIATKFVEPETTPFPVLGEFLGRHVACRSMGVFFVLFKVVCSSRIFDQDNGGYSRTPGRVEGGCQDKGS